MIYHMLIIEILQSNYLFRRKDMVINMKKHSTHSIDKLFWGLFFVAGAVMLILSKLGTLPDLSFLSIVFTIIFAWTFLKGIFSINFFEILFSAAFLAWIYDDVLGITALTPWTLLGAALLGSIGLSLLFPGKHRWHVFRHNSSDDSIPYAEEVVDIPDEETIHLENSFGASIKYINSQNFRNAHLETSFGEMKVYYDNAFTTEKQVYTKIDVAFGNMVLYVPKTWQVINNIDCSFGAVDIKNQKSYTPLPEAPVLVITGSVAFGGAEIIYV